MYYTIYALDRPDAGDLRVRTRTVHREYLHNPDLPVRLILAGPLLDDDGETMVGSLIVVEAPSREAVEAFSGADPYRTVGLIGSVVIRPWNWNTGNPDMAAH
jgi:uncharacterized protein YciI